MHEPATILIADDDPGIRRILEFMLEHAGYRVLLAEDGRQALALLAEERPDLALLDVMMPRLDGFSTLRAIREDRALHRLPVIMLTARGERTARVHGLRGGANDYVAKPFDQDELLARVANLLDTSRAQRDANPLTGLPGNHAIEREIERRLAANDAFAAMYVDIDRFKSFNDRYGYTRGDRAIDLLAHVMCEVVDRSPGGGFVGHVGGDDFLLLCASDQAADVAARVIRDFEAGVEHLHDPEDWARGHLLGRSRTGEPVASPLVSLTIAVITDVQDRYRHPAELSDTFAELKTHGKRQRGSVIVHERRTPGETAEPLGIEGPGAPDTA